MWWSERLYEAIWKIFPLEVRCPNVGQTVLFCLFYSFPKIKTARKVLPFFRKKSAETSKENHFRLTDSAAPKRSFDIATSGHHAFDRWKRVVSTWNLCSPVESKPGTSSKLTNMAWPRTPNSMHHSAFEEAHCFLATCCFNRLTFRGGKETVRVAWLKGCARQIQDPNCDKLRQKSFLSNERRRQFSHFINYSYISASVISPGRGPFATFAPENYIW